ncbi:sphingomyelin phosphodiesterase, partial [Caerostris extrusa]
PLSPNRGRRCNFGLTEESENKRHWWMLLNSTDPGHELEWLVHQLQDAELHGEKVHIIGHIPPGHSDCLPVWSANYYRIINRFENTVAGQFFGHSHLDELEVFYGEDQRPTSVAYIGPSVTSYDGVNPSYRIYTVDGSHPKSSSAVLDHETYYLNLTEANLWNRPTWRMSYSAAESMACTLCNLISGTNCWTAFKWTTRSSRSSSGICITSVISQREECTGNANRKPYAACALPGHMTHPSAIGDTHIDISTNPSRL